MPWSASSGRYLDWRSSAPHAGGSTTTEGRADEAPRRSVHPDGLDVGEFPDAVVRQLPSVARPFDAAEGQVEVRDRERVDEHHARLDLLGEAPLLGGVFGPGIGAEPEVGVVGERYRLVDVADPEEGGDGAEDLVSIDAHVGRYARQSRWLYEPAWAVHRPS